MNSLTECSSAAAATVVLGLLVLLPANASASPGAISADRGGQVFDQLGCLTCHSVGGSGGSEASDLRRRVLTGDHSPAAVASRIWNHAPEMWRSMDQRGITPQHLSVDQAEDIFAYFWSNRRFDPHGEAIRGKRAFSDKGCASCHALSRDEAEGSAPAVAEWEALGDPVAWAQSLWNHSRQMYALNQAEGRGWPTFTEQEMADLLIYLQNLKPQRDRARRLVLGSSEHGSKVFDRKACSVCHSERDGGASSFSETRGFTTLTALSAAMWNHTPEAVEEAKSDPQTSLERMSRQEMDAIILHLMRSGALDDKGSPARGSRLFVKKGCVTCHGASGSVPSAGSDWPVSAAAMVSAAWNHGPVMAKSMEMQGVRWPKLSTREVQDLLAYLEDAARGRAQP